MSEPRGETQSTDAPQWAAFPWEREAASSTGSGSGWASAPEQPVVGGSHWVQPTEPPLPIADVKLAGYVPRIVAWLIDSFILTAFLIVVIVVVPAGLSEWSVALLLAALVVYLSYYPVCWTHGGQTIGMRLAHIRVVRDPDAAPVGWKAAVLRLLGFAVNGFVLYLGWLWIFIDRRRRGWHDLLARTVVVDDPSLQAWRSSRG